jgi:hypothetical protein
MNSPVSGDNHQQRRGQSATQQPVQLHALHPIL